MWLINEHFEDHFNDRRKSLVFLDADTPINPYHITYPIIWSGFLNNEKIILKQLSHSASHITDYEFIEYPDKYNYLMNDVVKIIDRYLRILD